MSNRERAWTAEQVEDSRCPTTYRREGAVKTLIGLGWKWDGQQWQAEQAGGVVPAGDVAAFNQAMKTCNGPLLTEKASYAASWDAVTFFQSHAKSFAPLLRAPGGQGGRMDEDAAKRAIEARNAYLLEHPGDAVGGMKAALAQNAKVDATYPFESALAELIEAVDPSIDSGDIIADARIAAKSIRAQNAQVEGEDAIDRAVEAFQDVYDGVSHNLREAIQHVLATASLTHGKAVGWVSPEAIEHLDKRSGVANVPMWNCSGDGRAPIYIHAERARVPDARALHVLKASPDEPQFDPEDFTSVDTRLYFWRTGWNACRESMLAAATSQPARVPDAVRHRLTWLADITSDPSMVHTPQERERIHRFACEVRDALAAPSQPEDAA